MKPLQALERLTKIHTHDEFKECYDIIETALKAVEIIKENCFLKEHMGDVCLVSKRYITDKQKIDLLKELFE